MNGENKEPNIFHLTPQNAFSGEGVRGQSPLRRRDEEETKTPEKSKNEQVEENDNSQFEELLQVKTTIYK